MTRTPNKQSPPQAFFHRVGAKKLGPDATNVLNDNEVRRQGRNRVLGRVGASVLAIAGLAYMNHQFNASPTVNKIEDAHIHPVSADFDLGSPVYTQDQAPEAQPGQVIGK